MRLLGILTGVVIGTVVYVGGLYFARESGAAEAQIEMKDVDARAVERKP